MIDDSEKRLGPPCNDAIYWKLIDPACCESNHSIPTLRRRLGIVEQRRADSLLSIVKDAAELETDQRIGHLAQRPERQTIVDLVLDHRHAVALEKAMRVDPLGIRSADLLVDELVRWRPTGNLAPPTKWDAEQP